MDVFRQRLEDEYAEEIIVTRPLVPVRSALFLELTSSQSLHIADLELSS
jgi:translation elongation factor EF-4